MELKKIIKLEEDGISYSVDVERLNRLAERKDIAFASELKRTDAQMVAFVGAGRIPGLEQGYYLDRQGAKWALLAGLEADRIRSCVNDVCPAHMRYLAVAGTDIKEISFNLGSYLRELWLIDNPKLHTIYGLKGLSDVQKLKLHLNLWDTELNLSEMRGLEELDLRGTELGGIRLDDPLKYLKKCDLRGAKIEDQSFLNNCPALEWLAISDDGIPLSPSNPLPDQDYLVGHMQNTGSEKSDGNDDSFCTTMEIVNNFKEWVEYHRGATVIQEADSGSREKTVQCLIRAVADGFCKRFNWDISPESDSGRGPVDFKISRGNDKTVVEVKLTSNSQCVHGLEVQIEEYAKAEATDKKVFILINTGQGEARIKAVADKREQMLSAGKHPAEVVVIDARPKNAASTYQ